MAGTYKAAVATANAMVAAETALCNTGYLRIYSAPQPTNPDTAISGATLLAELRFAATAFGTPASGSAAAATIASVTALATGTPTWFRILKSDGTTVVGDGDVSTTAAGTGALQFDNTSWVAGGTVQVTSFSLAEPAD